MFEEDNDYTQITDYIGGKTLYTLNDNPQNCFLDTSIVGTGFNVIANGTTTDHNWLTNQADYNNTDFYSDWSISFWVKVLDPATAGNDRYILNMNYSYGFYFYISNSGTDFRIRTSNSDSIASTVTPLTDNVYHVVITNDISDNSTGFKLYINGTLRGSCPAAYLQIYNINWYVGDSGGTSGDAAVSSVIFDELAIYSRILDSTDISNLYNSGTAVDFIQKLQTGRMMVADTFGLTSAAAWSFNISVTDQLGLNDNFLTALLMLLADAADQTGVTDTTPDDPTIIFLPIVEDNLATADTYDVTSAMSAVASDGVNFVTAFNVDGEAYIGVVMNTQNQAVTEYGNFDFNSMAYLGGNKYYGAKADGIHELDGSDDAGSQIDALLSTHLMNFGSQEWKRVERAYLGLRNDGPMVLKTIVRDDATGERKEYWYELTETSEAARIERIKVGKGLKSHLWQFELHNNEGSDFDLDSLEFVPIVLSRRV